MTNKQTMALLYAIDAYLTDKDNETLTAQGNGEYFRGFRDGAAEVIGYVTKLMSEYSFDARRFGNKQKQTREPSSPCTFCDHIFDLDSPCTSCDKRQKVCQNCKSWSPFKETCTRKDGCRYEPIPRI